MTQMFSLVFICTSVVMVFCSNVCVIPHVMNLLPNDYNVYPSSPSCSVPGLCYSRMHMGWCADYGTGFRCLFFSRPKVFNNTCSNDRCAIFLPMRTSPASPAFCI